MGRYQLYKAADGFRWRYVASNGRIIGVSSEAYVNKTDCNDAIVLMKGSAAAPVEDLT